MSAPAVSFDQVSFRYGVTPVLEDVSFTVEPGASTCVIGPNGGGKTTLIRLALGLLEPKKGKIEIFGKSPEEGCHRIGYVPQAMRFDPLFPVNARDIVLMGRLDQVRFGFYTRECREAADAALAEVGLEREATMPFSNLSGGQRQRVLIARALATGADLLLLDEPTANVDLTVEAKFLESLDHLRERATIVLVTHDIDLISRLGDSVLCVNHRVHRHDVGDLHGELLREIFSGEHRLEHDRKTRHQEGDHSACHHD
jgi:zinc transport system ATP-binding protein